MNKSLINYIAKLELIEVRECGKSPHMKTRYSVGKDASVALTKQQYNMVQTMHMHPEYDMDEVFVAAGYKWKENISNNFIEIRSAKRKMLEYGTSRLTPAMTTLLVYLKKGMSEEIKLDAQWILHESVSLLEAAKRAKNFSVAARILDNLGTHIDIDSKVSNKLVVEGAVDYAALLAEAGDRVVLEEIVDVELEVLKLSDSATVNAQTESPLTTAEEAIVQVIPDKEPDRATH